jgi:hypothetical protein
MIMRHGEVLVDVIASIGQDGIEPVARSADLAGDRPGRARVKQRDQLGTPWRLPPVSVTVSGMPSASTIRWCF